MSTLRSFEFDLGTDTPNFSSQFGTLKEQKSNDKPKADAAEIIHASASGLDSVTNFVSMFMNGGQSSTNQNNYTPPPAETNPKISPMAIAGIVGGVVLLIIVLILLKNGKSSQ